MTRFVMILIAAPLIAQVTDVQVGPATPTQTVLSFNVANPTNCEVWISVDPDFSTRVNDTNADLFPGSTLCTRAGSLLNGSQVTFVAGARTSRRGADGAFYSLALEANRIHYFRIRSGDSIVDGSFQTQNPPFGNTYPEPPPFNRDAPYHAAWPTILPAADRNHWFIDPMTGIAASPITGPGQNTVNLGTTQSNVATSAAVDVAEKGSWTGLRNALQIDGNVATSFASNQDALFLRDTPWCAAGWSLQPAGSDGACISEAGRWAQGDRVHPVSIDDVQVRVALSCTGSAGTAEIALSVDGVGASTDWKQIPCGSSLSTITFPPSASWPGPLKGSGRGKTVFGAWFDNQVHNGLARPDIMPHSGRVRVENNGQVSWVSGDKFRVSNLSPGSRITLSGTEYRITRVNSPISMEIAGAPPAGDYKYFSFNFGVLVRKPQAPDGLLSVDGATFTDYESSVGQSPISGAVNLCSTRTVTDSNGVVLRPCLLATNADRQLMVIEEATGKSRYIGIASILRCSGSNCASGVSDPNGLNSYQPLQLSSWAQFNPKDPRHFYGFTTDLSGNGVLIDQFYDASPRVGQCPGDWVEITPDNCPSYPYNDRLKQNNLTPASSGNLINSKAAAFNRAQRAIHPEIPVFDPAVWFFRSPLAPADMQNGWQTVFFDAGQDTFGWSVVLDPTAPGVPIVAMVSSYGAQNCRWCTNHGSWTQAGYFGMAVKGGAIQNQQAGAGRGQYILPAGPSLDGAAEVCSGITNPRFAQYNGQQRCARLSVAGAAPCHDTVHSLVLNSEQTALTFPATGPLIFRALPEAFNGTVIVEGTADGYKWQSLSFSDPETGNLSPSLTLAGAGGSLTRLIRPPFPNGAYEIRIRLTSHVSGKITGYLTNEIPPTWSECSWHPGWSQLIPWAEGDMVDDGNDGGEMFLIVQKLSDTSMLVVRQYSTPAWRYGRAGNFQNHPAPWNLRFICSANDGDAQHGGLWWANLKTDPNGQGTGTPDWPMTITGHMDYWIFPNQVIYFQPPYVRIKDTMEQTMGGPIDFGLMQSGPFNSFRSGLSDYLQTHLGVSRDPNSPRYAIDKNPLSNNGSTTNTLWPQNATRVTGDLWRIAAADVHRAPSVPWPDVIRSLPYVMWSGGYLLEDVSGPDCALTGAADSSWKFGVVLQAGECSADSQVGDVYVNVPQSGHNGWCGPWDYDRNLCGTTWDHTAMGVNQYYFPENRDITDGSAFRRLSLVFNRPNFESVFSSGQGSFGGQFAFGQSDYYSGGARSDLFILRLPEAVADGVRRDGFQLLSIPLNGQDNASKARARFGYAENGPATGFYCTFNRKEECRTSPSATAAMPFYFASDPNQELQDCADGCTIQIPAIAGRVLYYVIDRLDDAGNIIETSAPGAFAVQ